MILYIVHKIDGVWSLQRILERKQHTLELGQAPGDMPSVDAVKKSAVFAYIRDVSAPSVAFILTDLNSKKLTGRREKAILDDMFLEYAV